MTDNNEQAQQPAITIEHVGNGRVKMQSGHIVAIEKVCSECGRLFWLPVRDAGPFRMNGHRCERMGGAAVINKYG